MSQISPAAFKTIRDEHKDKRIVYCSGMFDLLHPGHILFLEDCKKEGDILVVGVGGDKNVKKNKNPGRPIMDEMVRIKLVDALKPVDYCFLSGHTPIHHPLEFLETVFNELKPNIYVVNEDASDIPYRKELSEKYNVPIKILERWCPPEFEGISTTTIIEKIRGKQN